MTTRDHYSETGNISYQTPINTTPAIDIAHSVSVNTIHSLQNEYLFNEAIQGGYRFQGRMSNIRRFFCLLITFDVLFIGLMWLICIMLHGEDIWDAIDKQIKHYNIKTSLFDIFFLAICRFLLLWFFYGIFYMNNRIIIFITTFSTSAFAIAKVFYYDWHQTSQPVFEVLSILASFIIAWGETWCLDYRVFPQETYANQFFIASTDERAPLIQHYLRGAASSRYTESVENFHSPMHSPDGSLYRFQEDTSPVNKYPPYDFSKDEEEKYHTLARNIMDESKELLRSEKWKLDREDRDGVVAHYMNLPSGHRIFRITASFKTSPRNMLNEVFYEIETIPKWNSALLEARRVQIFDDFTDIIYQVSTSGAGGLVSSRDFVSLRHWKQSGSAYLIATRGTDHPNVPKNNKYVRGENGVSCIMMEPGEDANQCKMQFILNTNLRGWIPQAIVDLAIVDTLFDYTRCLTTHINKKYLPAL